MTRRPTDARPADAPALHSAVLEVFRDVFEDPLLVVVDTTVAREVEGWDSLGHINLVVALEQRFSVQFTLSELNALRQVGDLELLLRKKMGIE